MDQGQGESRGQICFHLSACISMHVRRKLWLNAHVIDSSHKLLQELLEFRFTPEDAKLSRNNICRCGKDLCCDTRTQVLSYRNIYQAFPLAAGASSTSRRSSVRRSGHHEQREQPQRRRRLQSLCRASRQHDTQEQYRYHPY